MLDDITKKIKLYKDTGHISMKYVYLASLISTDIATEEEQQAILNGISKYYDKGDIVYDTLYEGLFNLYVFDLLSKAYMEDDETKAKQYMQDAITYCNNKNNQVFNNLYDAVDKALKNKFSKC